MAKRCERCGFHAESADDPGCPECGSPLKFTLLPPPGTPVPPIPGVPTGPTGKLGDNPMLADGSYAEPPGLFSHYIDWRLRTPVLVVVVLGVVVAVLGVVTRGR